MTGLGGLFRDSRSPCGLVDENAVPRAIRPAVEIIARLSAERNKLRAEVARLREIVRKAPCEGDLAQLRAERDALARELAVLKTRGGETRHDVGVASRDTSRRGSRPVGLPLTKLVERLERAITRVERLEAAPSRAGASTSAPRSARHSAPVTRRPAPRSGGMLAGLVKENVSLRSDAVPRGEEPAARAKATNGSAPKIPAGGRRVLVGQGPAGDCSATGSSERASSSPAKSATARGGGFLHGLFSQNLSLRGPGKNT